MMRRRVSSLVFFLALLGASLPHAYAQSAGAVPEYAMVTAYLYNFALLTSWPGPAKEELNLCVVGQDELGPVIDTLQGKRVEGQSIQVVHLDRAREVASCRILFLAEGDRKLTSRILASISDSPVLVVTNDKRFRDEATIFLESDRQRLAFDVNAETAKRANLKLSSKLLLLARHVIQH